MAYSGENQTEFAEAVTLINGSAPNLLKEILKTTGNQTNYSGINPDFPRVVTGRLLPAAITPELLRQEKEIIDATSKILEACQVLHKAEAALDRNYYLYSLENVNEHNSAVHVLLS